MYLFDNANYCYHLPIEVSTKYLHSGYLKLLEATLGITCYRLGKLRIT